MRHSVALCCVARLQGGEGVYVVPVERNGGGVALWHSLDSPLRSVDEVSFAHHRRGDIKGGRRRIVDAYSSTTVFVCVDGVHSVDYDRSEDWGIGVSMVGVVSLHVTKMKL